MLVRSAACLIRLGPTLLPTVETGLEILVSIMVSLIGWRLKPPAMEFNGKSRTIVRTAGSPFLIPKEDANWVM
jgi:hypothetical protein